MLETPGTLREGAPDFARRADLSSQEPKVIATRVEAIATRVGAIATRVVAIAIRVEAIAGHRY